FRDKQKSMCSLNSRSLATCGLEHIGQSQKPSSGNPRSGFFGFDKISLPWARRELTSLNNFSELEVSGDSESPRSSNSMSSSGQTAHSSSDPSKTHALRFKSFPLR